MKRRSFVQRGTLTLSLAGVAGELFSFVPDNFYTEGIYKNTIPFRKPLRSIREVVHGFLWADAADFSDYGGWALDTQHVGFMGSSYLIAHGTRKTVADAVLEIQDATPGQYRLWVRSRNWIPEHAPGKFGVRVNGKDSGKVYGAQQEKEWSWQDGGIHVLPAGRNELKLQDQTGQYGRCSSMILTRELNYHPPAELEDFKKERARLSGVSGRIQKMPVEYDVVVVGAGVSGCCAAISAARQGARVALVSDRPVLGGNASVEIGVPVQGAAQHHGVGRETGVIEEAGRLGKAKGWGQVMSQPFAELVTQEKTLDLFKDAWLEEVKMDGSRIRKAILRDTLTGERRSLAGRMFIDSTGDAWLGYRAGAESRLGREARQEHNESAAPEKADNITMSGCLRGPRSDYRNCQFYRTVQESTIQTYTPPPWLYKLPAGWFNDRGLEAHHEGEAKAGTWWNEHPGEVDDLWNPEFARDELIRVNYTLWNFWKNDWKNRHLLANYRMDYLPFMVGKRETRRLMGDYILNQNDCEAGKPFSDAIGHYGWTMDIHAPQGILSTTGRYHSDIRVPIGQIPYRCLYSRNVDNLLMAGRNVSVSHIALGTVRVEGTCSVMGQAAGTAAALAVQHGTTPRGIYQKHMKELQQLLLKNDQSIPEVRNQDSSDLARTAVATASSVNRSDPAGVGKARWLPLSTGRGEFFEWVPGKKLKSVKLHLEAESDRTVTLHLREAKSLDDLSSIEDVASVSIDVPAGTRGWVEFPLDTVLESSAAWLYLDADSAVKWQAREASLSGRFRFYGTDGNWTRVDGSGMAVRFEPGRDAGEMWPPTNVLNGFAHPTKEASNMWESSPKETLPQWIELKLKHPSRVGAIQCVFDTDLTMSLARQGEARPSVCVRDYTLECWVGGVWKRVVRERDNVQRFRRHRFVQLTTNKIRLTVEATHGANTARVLEMRVYES